MTNLIISSIIRARNLSVVTYVGNHSLRNRQLRDIKLFIQVRRNLGVTVVKDLPTEETSSLMLKREVSTTSNDWKELKMSDRLSFNQERSIE